jgi:hypothetical protein
MLLIPVAAGARDAASVRLGDHSSYIRVVLETPHAVHATVLLDPAGLTATVTASADLDIAIPARMIGVITAIDKTGGQDNASGITLHFRVPVKLTSQSTLPPDAATGQRFVLDFQPVEGSASLPPVAAAPKPAQPAPPAANRPRATQAPAPEPAEPPAKPGKFILSGFRSALFGLSTDNVLVAIEADFGHEVRVGVTQSGSADKRLLTLISPPLLPNTTPPTIVYTIEPLPRGLSLVQVTWNGLGGAGLTEADAAKITQPMTTLFKSVEFLGGHSVTGIGMPDGRLVVFQGIDAAGNSVRMIRQTAKTAAEGDQRYVIEMTYAAALIPTVQ